MATEQIVRTTQDLGRLFQMLSNLDLTKPKRIVIKDYREQRSLDQNALFHCWVAEIAEFFVDNGKTHFATGNPITKEAIKDNLVRTFAGTEQREYIDLKTGEVYWEDERKRTRDMDRGEMHHLLSQIDSWAFEHGIPLRRRDDDEYMKLAAEMEGSASA